MTTETKCYACDAAAVGQTDHNGERKAACGRHADPRLPKLTDCVFCGTATRSGAVFMNLDGPQKYAHAKCHLGATKY